MSQKNADVACRERSYEITKKDLPLSCPPQSARLWDAHPRVYLAIEENGGSIRCPYCSAFYTLTD